MHEDDKAPDDRLVPTRREWVNLGWRSGWTFVEAAVAMLGAEAVFDWDVSTVELAVASGAAAVLTVIKNFASVRLGRQRPSGGAALSAEGP